MKNGRIAGAICFILALVAVLSVIPVALHFWICEFSAKCFVSGLWHSITASARFRPFAIVMVLAPLICLPLYVVALFTCRRTGDALDR